MFKKVLMVAAVLVVGAAAPAAAQYPEIVVNPGQVNPGGAVSVTGQSCTPGETAVITLHEPSSGARAIPAEGIQVATAEVDAEGNFSTSFNLPEGTDPGSYEVAVQCAGTTRVELLEVLGTSVTPPTSPPATTPPSNGGSGDLPRTGSDLNGYGLVGAGLLTVGGLFLIGARKRRSDATA